MGRRIKDTLHEKNGASMVSVIIAFLMLLILLGGFTTAIVASGKILAKAQRINQALGEATEGFYTGAEDELAVGETVSFSVTEKNGTQPAFTLEGKIGTAVFRAEESDGITIGLDYYLSGEK